MFIFIQSVESVGNQASGVSEEDQRWAAPTAATSTATSTTPSFCEASGKRGHPACRVCVCAYYQQYNELMETLCWTEVNWFCIFLFCQQVVLWDKSKEELHQRIYSQTPLRDWEGQPPHMYGEIIHSSLVLLYNSHTQVIRTSSDYIRASSG